MSNSRQGSEGPVERSSNFAQTCNLLSRYVKEKGSLKNLNIEIGGKVESLDAIVKPGSSFAASPPATVTSLRNERLKKSAQQSSAGQEDASNKNSTSKEKAVADRKPAQLTIFYSGKVLVFNDYPMDKARELVSIAKKSSSQMSYGILPLTLDEKSNHTARERFPPRQQSKEKPDLTKQPLVMSSNTSKDKANGTAASSSRGENEQLSPQSDANGSDLPIARRSSIHRFLEKRKDRASGRMPYHYHEQPGSSSSSSKGDGGIDLNL